MPKTPKPRKPKPDRHYNFILLPHDLIDSLPFQELTNSSRVVLILLMRQKGRNPDQPSVKFPYTDARKYLNGTTFSRAITELVKFGFIELETAKRLGSDIRQPNVYRFSTKWKQLPIQMADSRRCPNNRSVKNLKTGLFTPINRSMVKDE